MNNKITAHKFQIVEKAARYLAQRGYKVEIVGSYARTNASQSMIASALFDASC